MSDTRSRILTIAATLSVASTLAATTAAGASSAWIEVPVAATLAETKESKTEGDRARDSTKPPPAVTTQPASKATTPPGALWTDKDKAPRR